MPRTGDLAKDLRHEDPRVRAQAAKGTVEAGRRDLLPILVENLADHDAAVRMFAALALRKLTGEDFGYDPSAPAFEREKAIIDWREWIAGHGEEGARAGEANFSGKTDGSGARAAEDPSAAPAPSTLGQRAIPRGEEPAPRRSPE